MLRLGLVGTGRMASIHFNNLLQSQLATITSVFSTTKERATDFLSNFNSLNVTACDVSDMSSVTKSSKLDGMIITSASSNHYSQIMECIKQGIPLFVEKPIADTIEQIDDIFNNSINSRIPVLVGYQRRYDLNILKIKTSIENKVLKCNENDPNFNLMKHTPYDILFLRSKNIFSKIQK